MSIISSVLSQKFTLRTNSFGQEVRPFRKCRKVPHDICRRLLCKDKKVFDKLLRSPSGLGRNIPRKAELTTEDVHCLAKALSWQHITGDIASDFALERLYKKG